MVQINLDEVSFISETSITIRNSRRRTTVPKEIVEKFHLKDGDRLRWILFDDGKILINCVHSNPS
ncbi:MAG: AbrB/MazE/SpoVT family DNA-binding domain-containing protein [Promethearchaeota archaeon]